MARMSGVTVQLALAVGYNVFPGLFWADVDLVGNSPHSLTSREDRKRERKHCLSWTQTRATAPLTLATGIREQLSRISPSRERLRNSFIYFPSLPRSLILPSMSRFRERLQAIRAYRISRIIEDGKLDARVLFVKLSNLSVTITKNTLLFKIHALITCRVKWHRLKWNMC